MTLASFQELRDYVFKKSLPNDLDIEALIVFTVINDLGKVRDVVRKVRYEYGKGTFLRY